MYKLLSIVYLSILGFTLNVSANEDLVYEEDAVTHEFKSAAFNNSGDWVFFYGKNGYAYSGIPTELGNTIKEKRRASHEFKCVAFNDDGDWVFFYGTNGYAYSGIPNDLAEKIKQKYDANYEFKSVTFNDDGDWVFFYGTNGYSYSGMPTNFADQIQDCRDDGVHFTTAHINNNNDWALFWGKNGAARVGIPEKLSETISRKNTAKYKFKCIAFNDNGDWLFFYGSNGYAYSGIPVGLANKIKEKREDTKPTPTPISKSTIHFVLFTDTDDSRVGTSCEETNKYFKSTFVPKLRSHTGMKVKTYYYSGHQKFELNKLNSTISSMQTSSNDVIFFYFAGHGYNRGSSDFPTITLGMSGQTLNSRQKDLITVFDRLKQKQHRLLVVMAEACNKVYAQRNDFRLGQLVNNFTPHEDEIRHFKRLFTVASGDYLMSSSKKDQLSHLATGQPGFFTCAFRDAFDYYVDRSYSGIPTWEKIFSKTKSNTIRNAQEIGELQYPQWCKGSNCN